MKRIPICNNFYVSEDGKVYDNNGNERKTYVNGDGYITVAIRVNGAWTTTGVHRLVAMTYVPNDSPETRKHVNHIDGDVTNNHYTNLDWVSVAENNIHHGLMTNAGRHYRIIGTKDGVESGYTSFADVSSKTGESIGDVWKSIKLGVSVNGYVFRYRPWSEPLTENLIRPSARLHRGEPYRKQIKTLNVKNGKVKVYGTVRECAKEHKMRPGHVSYFLSNKTALLKHLYQVAYLEDDFYEIPASQLKTILERGKKKVLVHDERIGGVREYASAKEFILENRLSKKKITSRLVKSGVQVVKPFAFIYASGDGQVKMAEYLKIPVLDTQTSVN